MAAEAPGFEQQVPFPWNPAREEQDPEKAAASTSNDASEDPKAAIPQTRQSRRRRGNKRNLAAPVRTDVILDEDEPALILSSLHLQEQLQQKEAEPPATLMTLLSGHNGSNPATSSFNPTPSSSFGEALQQADTSSTAIFPAVSEPNRGASETTIAQQNPPQGRQSRHMPGPYSRSGAERGGNHSQDRTPSQSVSVLSPESAEQAAAEESLGDPGRSEGGHPGRSPGPDRAPKGRGKGRGKAPQAARVQQLPLRAKNSQEHGLATTVLPPPGFEHVTPTSRAPSADPLPSQPQTHSQVGPALDQLHSAASSRDTRVQDADPHGRSPLASPVGRKATKRGAKARGKKSPDLSQAPPAPVQPPSEARSSRGVVLTGLLHRLHGRNSDGSPRFSSPSSKHLVQDKHQAPSNQELSHASQAKSKGSSSTPPGILTASNRTKQPAVRQDSEPQIPPGFEAPSSSTASVLPVQSQAHASSQPLVDQQEGAGPSISPSNTQQSLETQEREPVQSQSIAGASRIGENPGSEKPLDFSAPSLKTTRKGRNKARQAEALGPEAQQTEKPRQAEALGPEVQQTGKPRAVASGRGEESYAEGQNKHPSATDERKSGRNNRRKSGRGVREVLAGGEEAFQDFEPYWGRQRVSESLEHGQAFKCELRINAGDRKSAFAAFEGLPTDIQLKNLHAQNRAFPGDEVVVVLNQEVDWILQNFNILRSSATASPSLPESVQEVFIREETYSKIEHGVPCDNDLSACASMADAKKILIDRLKARPDLRPTGKVVAISKESERRSRVVGVLKNVEGSRWMLIPCDARMPQCRVEGHRCPDALRKMMEEDPEKLAQQLVCGMISSWNETSETPEALVRSSLGEAGELEAETKAILEMEGIETREFSPQVLACLPPTPWTISPEETAKRRDLRLTRLFTIDPPTARDLDDALSIESLGNGRWQVGVHIADVSFFIPPGSALDKEAAHRATSTYMIQEVIHMLPRLLCEELCSLNAGVDRLAFSVIWELDEQGHVHSQWTGRTVIRSCVKLAYHHAQKMVDGTFDKNAEGLPLPELPHTWEEVISDVLAMNKIARNLHRRRFEGGALRLDKTKLSFGLNPDGNPEDFKIYEQEEANELVAEFMLLANMSVAQLIGRAYPENAMLRRHPPPQDRQLGDLEAISEKLGYDIDCSSSATIHQSLRRLKQEGADPHIIDVIQLQIVRPMKPANYFSTGTYSDVSDWRHYALAAPMYTHFTSPIRRYPDVVVHRLLASLLASDPLAATRQFSPKPFGMSSENPGPTQANFDEAEEIVLDAEMSASEGDEGTGAELGDDSDSDDSGPVGKRTAASSDDEEIVRPPAPRLLAQRRKSPSSQLLHKPAEPLISSEPAIPVPSEALDSERLQDLATHCNLRKYSAKLCSEQSSYLYLCVLMRSQPTVLEAIVTIVNGRKFFDIYIPAIGAEERVSVLDMKPQVYGDFKAETRLLTLTEMKRSKGLLHEEEGTAASLKNIKNLDKLHNPGELEPVTLPLMIKSFQRIPVVVSAGSEEPGKPMHLITALYISVDNKNPQPSLSSFQRRSRNQNQGRQPAKPKNGSRDAPGHGGDLPGTNAGENTVQAENSVSHLEGPPTGQDAPHAEQLVSRELHRSMSIPESPSVVPAAPEAVLA